MNRDASTRRLVLVAAIAAIATAVLYARVYADFPRVRIQAAAAVAASSDGRITVPLPRVPALEGEPMSLVLLLQSDALEDRSVFVHVNGRELARVALRGERTTRADVLVPADLTRAADLTLTLQSTHAAWSLQLLEAGNAYGFSRGAFSLVIAPSGTTRYRAVPLWLAVLVGAGLFVATRRLARPIAHRGVRIAHRIMAALFLAVMVATLVLPAVSVYAVLLSLKAFVLAVALIHFPVLNVLFWRVEPTLTAGLRGAGRLVAAHRYRVLAALTVWMFLVSIAGLYDARTGFTAFIGFGEQFASSALPSLQAVPHYVDPSSGYDGQFYAQLALDPLLRDPAIEGAIDNLAYRGRRILFAWTAYALGLGQPEWIVHAYAMQNILCWLLLAGLLFRWLPPTSLRNFVAWFACLFAHGLVSSVTGALLEGPGLLVIALAIAAVERGRSWLGTCLIGLAGLGRETNILAGAALVDRPTRVSRLVTLAAQAIVVVLPLAVWLLYLRWSHPAAGPDLGSSTNFATPLSGLLEEWRVTVATLRAEGWASYARLDLMAVTGVTLQGVFLVFTTVRNWRLPWHRVGLAYVALMLCLGMAVWEGYPGAYTRVLVPMAWAYNILLPRERPWVFWPLAIAGNLTVLNGLEALKVPYLWPYL